MKNYNEYSHIDIIGYGIRTFLVMSTDYFSYLKDEIDLLNEINFTEELKSYARQFCEIAMPSIGQSTPNRKVPEDHFDKASLMKAWEDIFIHLEKLGYDKVILTWFNHLMKIDLYFAVRLHEPSWTSILLVWHKIKEIETGPGLPQHINQQITIFLLQEQVRKFEWCCKLRLWVEADEDIWSKYVMQTSGISSSMKGMIREHGLLKMWVALSKILKDDDIIEVEKWGKSAFEKFNITEYFSLPQLAMDLKKHGY